MPFYIITLEAKEMEHFLHTSLTIEIAQIGCMIHIGFMSPPLLTENNGIHGSQIFISIQINNKTKLAYQPKLFYPVCVIK